MATSAFHPEALHEYAEATQYLLQKASVWVAQNFVDEVESQVASILNAPERWRVVENPGIRRCIVRRFPYVLYYRYDRTSQSVTIFAVMHCSRNPGYWKHRTSS